MNKIIPIESHSERAHATFSASGSSRWLACPASIKEEYGKPNTSSPSAIEGTRAHEVADMCLKSDVDAIEFLGKEIEGGIVDKDMVHFVQQYLDYVRDFRSMEEDSVLMCEQRVDFSHIAIPDTFGTLDSAVLLPKSRVLHIFDLKYGKGIEVSAVENEQGLCYASGIENQLQGLDFFDRIVIHIVQPRIYNFSEWEIDLPKLYEWQEYVKKRVELAVSEDPPYNPSDETCQWCKAKASCPALFKQMNDLVFDLFDDLDDTQIKNVELETVTDEQLRQVLDQKALLLKWLSAIEEMVESRIMAGGEFEGYKLVEGRSNTTWKPESEAELVELLGEEAYKKTLIGVTEGRKLLSKELFAQLSHKPEGKPKLVPSSVKGQPLVFASFTEYQD